MSDQIDFLLDSLPHLLFGFPGQRPGGLVMSVLLAVAGLGVGLAVAVVVAAAQDARSRSLRRLADSYVHLFRGIPLILLVLIIHQLVASGPILGLNNTPLRSAVIALVLYSSAYQADIIRTGLRSVPVGMVEWARVIGGSRWQVYRLVKLPYSLRVMQPALSGQGITLFKDTSVVVIIGVAELTTTARIVLGSDVGNTPFWVATYLTVGLLYFVVAFAVSRLALRGERRYQAGNLVRSLAIPTAKTGSRL
ncbi:MAG: ABC transporter permease subunit [Acidobacteria bacterium]|nr:ABC transporter permease subunit [Acidobacteriota bacterium]